MTRKQQKKPAPLKPAGKKTAAKADPKKNNNLFQLYVGIGAVLLLTLIAFFPSLKNDFTNWDDPALIVNNPLIKSLSGANIKRVFTEVYFANYQPLHLFSYMIEYHFFGLKASGYHWVSLLIHLVNVILVARIIYILSKNDYVTFFTALFFAISPLRVESVAWAAERKDMLYSMFFFAAMICYLLYVRKNLRMRNLVWAFLLFTLSIFSKAMAVSLVPVMFLIDYYYGRKFTARIVFEKLPFLALAIVLGLVSVTASKTAGSIDSDVNFTIIDRLFFASQNLLMYIGKSIYPFSLSGYYQYPHLVDGHIPVSYYICGVVVLAAAAGLFLARKKKVIIFSSGYFVATVALVLMVLPVGPTIFSERYSYVPSVMLYFVLMYYLFLWLGQEKQKSMKTAFSVGLVVYGLFFVTQVRARAEIWKNSISFWSDVIKTDPEVPIAYNNRGNEYKIKQDYPNAIADFRKAIEFNKNFPEPIFSLGDVYRSTGMYDSALIYANRALAIKPDMPQGLVNRGIVRAIQNNLDSAMMDFNKCIQINPDMFEAYSNRGNLNCILGRFDEGLQDYNMALKINPDLADAYINRGRLLKDKNKIDEAIGNFNTYIEKGGYDPRVYLLLGQCYAAKSDFASALSYGDQAKARGVAGVDAYLQQWKK